MVCGFMPALFYFLLPFLRSSSLPEKWRNARPQDCIKGFFKYSILGFFGVGIYLQIFVMEMILGIVFDILFFADVLRDFLNYEEKARVYLLFRAFDFALAIFVTAFLIYEIPDSTFQTILLSLASSLLGGGCTLAGVFLTLKRADREKEKDRIYDSSPLLATMFLDSFLKETTTNSFCGRLKDTKGGHLSFRFQRFFIKNSDHAYAILMGFYVNDHKFYLFETEKIFWKNEACSITIENELVLKENLTEFALLVEDVTGHCYSFPLSFKIQTSEGKHFIEIEDCFSPKMLDVAKNDL